ncbi:MAG: hypothetical protein K8S23_01035 [Candidatus Cloacimonetes bacterium]|nr:hypothetical protein [Candidatus Cloacimonadota bacterium]
MKCKFEKKIGAFLDNELQKEDFAQVKEHLKSCLICQQTLRELNSINIFFENYTDVEVPEYLNQRILSKINSSVSKFKKNIINFAVAASIAFAFFSGLFASNQTFTQNRENTEQIAFGTESFYSYLDWEE